MTYLDHTWTNHDKSNVYLAGPGLLVRDSWWFAVSQVSVVTEKAAFLQSLCKSTGKVVTKGKDTTQKEARKNCIFEATGSIGHNPSNCVHPENINTHSPGALIQAFYGGSPTSIKDLHGPPWFSLIWLWVFFVRKSVVSIDSSHLFSLGEIMGEYWMQMDA